MLLLKVAFRNIFRQTRRSVLTGLAMAGGFVLASFSIAWSDGTYHDVIDLFTRHRLGHIQVHARGYLDRPSLYKTLDRAAELGKIAGQQEDIDAWTTRVFSAGLASVGERTAAARIIGIDAVRETETTRFDRKITQGRTLAADGKQEAILGTGLARLLHAEVGDKAVLISQGADGSIANDVYTVVGIADSGDDAANLADVYLSLDDAQELLVLGDRVHELVLTVSRLDQVDSCTRELTRLLGDTQVSVEPWQEFAADFYRAMQADRKGMWITLFVIMLVVAVGVLNTVLMAVLERRREYGLLKALGTTPGQIFRLILLEINLLAAGSLILGAVVALGVNYFFSIHGITLPEPITYGGVEFVDLHTELNLNSFIIPAVTVALTATLVALPPAWSATRTDPAKAMRTT